MSIYRSFPFNWRRIGYFEKHYTPCKNISIEWKYIATNQAIGWESGYISKGIMGQLPILNDIFLTWKMLSNRRTKEIDNIVNKLLIADCDSYWIVSHNEGLRVAYELSKLQSKPVHLTVHDDWAGALCARSSKYFFFSHLANRLTIKTLNSVSSIDVISEGMKKYYYEIANVNAEVCHRFILNENFKFLVAGNLSTSKKIFSIGHIGSFYNDLEFFKFLELANIYFTKVGATFIFKSWGSNIKAKQIPKHLKIFWEKNNGKSEGDVVNELNKCDIVYCMYPFEKKQAIFAQTSLPTKLSTYIQSGKLIFGHGPTNSSLQNFLRETNLGVLWNSNKIEDGLSVFSELFKIENTENKWRNANEKYFGKKNLEIITRLLNK